VAVTKRVKSSKHMCVPSENIWSLTGKQ
jgi:hypothetical protein